MKHDRSVIVFGAGNFGTCLAQHLANKGESVFIWDHNKEITSAINLVHKNPKYLSEVKLNNHVVGIDRIDQKLINQCKSIVIAVPTQYYRSSIQQLKGMDLNHITIISASKGIEVDTLNFPLEILAQVLGEKIADDTTVISGPSFAIEVVHQQPTAVSFASRNTESCKRAQTMFHTNFFRAYSSNDPIGLEVAGAVKNVIAIAAGACKGLGLQQNARAALITRGLAEITKLGTAIGANPITFIGLGGVGDLFLTCSSEKSRNFTLGQYIGQGKSPEEARSLLKSVAEGWTTSIATYRLSQKLGTDTPVIDEVYHVLHENKPIKRALASLMNRTMKAELDLPNYGNEISSTNLSSLD